MATINEASAPERKHAMRAAVEYNLPCEIWVDSHGYPLQAKSRFFGLQAKSDAPCVIVEAPVLDGTILPLRPGQEVEVYFRVDDTRYMYHATVLNRGDFALNSGLVARALEITYPKSLARGQKRSHFRVPVSRVRPVELRYGLVDRKTPDPVARPAILFRGKSELVDLSAGGLAFDLPERNGLLVRPGRRLLCEFTLPTKERLTLHGRVAHRYPVHRENALRYGVQFVDIHRSVDFKAAHDRLLRYVVEVQRESLAKRSGIHE